jgi:poly(3-hydroxybutyrate) depolymerase
VHIPASRGQVGVVVLHSYRNDYAEPIRQGWSSLADKQHFVAIYPDRGSSWNAGLCCGPDLPQPPIVMTWTG